MCACVCVWCVCGCVREWCVCCCAADDLAESEIGLARKVVSKWRQFRYTSVRVRPNPPHPRHTLCNRSECLYLIFP